MNSKALASNFLGLLITLCNLVFISLFFLVITALHVKVYIYNVFIYSLFYFVPLALSADCLDMFQ